MCASSLYEAAVFSLEIPNLILGALFATAGIYFYPVPEKGPKRPFRSLIAVLGTRRPPRKNVISKISFGPA